MARLPMPSPGANISFGNVVDYMGLGRGFNSFDITEKTAMGGLSQADMTKPNSICMPYQIEALASKGSGSSGPGPAYDWLSVSTTPNTWRPTRISEYGDAYRDKPQVSGTASETGNAATAILNIICSNSEAYTGGSTPYYVYVCGSGTYANKCAWAVCSKSGSLGTQQQIDVSGLAATGTWAVYVCDWEGCGCKSEIQTQIKYNA